MENYTFIFFFSSAPYNNVFVDLLIMVYLNLGLCGKLLSTFWNGLCKITSSSKDHKHRGPSDMCSCFYFIIDFLTSKGQLLFLYIDLFIISNLLFTNYKCAFFFSYCVFSKRCIHTQHTLCHSVFKMEWIYFSIIKPHSSPAHIRGLTEHQGK